MLVKQVFLKPLPQTDQFAPQAFNEFQRILSRNVLRLNKVFF